MKILSATLEAQEAKIHEGLNPLNQVNENFSKTFQQRSVRM